MKKIFYLIGIAALFLVASCDNDNITESVPETKMYIPTVKGVFGSFTDTNPTTKAGVIEENEDYATIGEKFYWHDEDSVLLVFYSGDLSGERTVLTYRANVGEGEKPKNADFELVDGDPIAAGTYTVFGFYPASAWAEEGGVVTASLTGAIINETENGTEATIIADGPSSKYMGQNMFMKAKAENVVIGEETNQIDLSYQHLSSVVRLHIKNNNTPEVPRLSQVLLAKFVGDDQTNFFPTKAILDGGVDGTTLVAVEDSRVSQISLNIPDILNGTDFDLFIPLLPAGGFAADELFGLRSVFVSEEVGEGLYNHDVELDSSMAPWLEQGFEAGKSYYFNLTAWEVSVDDEE